MDLKILCEKIELPEEMKKKVLSASMRIDRSRVEKFYASLADSSMWDKSLEEMKESLGKDDDGSEILTVMLICALSAYEEYKKRGIGEDIFIDTMKFCTRFVNEHHSAYGSYSFVWAWWFPRQLSLREFRIGALEYEMIESDGELLINMHIPADADLSEESVKNSYRAAREFFCKFFPEYENADMVCDSWLLSSQLVKMLPPDSNIIRFREMFDIEKEQEDSNAGVRWVYKRDDIPTEDLPEKTSLQKKMKHHLLKGGKTGSAFGRFCADKIFK